MKNLIDNKNISLSEKKVINYIINNIDILDTMSIKQIANQLKVSESLITKSCQNVSFSGFKEFREYLLKQYHLKKNKDIKNDFYNSLVDSLKLSSNTLKYDLIENVADKLSKHKGKVIIFSTGKKAILAKYFYFTLLEYWFNCSLVSSLYNEENFDSKNAVIFVISISGNNSKVNRYLNIINSIKEHNFICALTANSNFLSKELIDFHIYGNVEKYFSINQKANPIIEKYTVMYLMDNLILSLFEKLENNSIEFFENVKSKNFI
ncbi:hypothetical protein [Spiroplasma endosymbiont of Atherix ibis]|uniref:MurR/RpiR family transcriptional regulator n=1 Tax=Spiroplasma endosymbiont of Atherix ibis TaxID=3066291 RepID=UPI0030D190FC